ncbi:unnamed protein product [Enterobius vermicularis]|uniref:Secreted protein n=1 Tax=Enterobius vermicularis TaxID=51028 RepID=A0A0N4VC48_ENTVE|nr:unnamed protein product [Enterobius vermicularis]
MITNRYRLVLYQLRAFASAAPKCTTGIEHAEELKKASSKSYFFLLTTDLLIFQLEMGPSRYPQPSKFKPDTLPSISTKL